MGERWALSAPLRKLRSAARATGVNALAAAWGYQSSNEIWNKAPSLMSSVSHHCTLMRSVSSNETLDEAPSLMSSVNYHCKTMNASSYLLVEASYH